MKKKRLMYPTMHLLNLFNVRLILAPSSLNSVAVISDDPTDNLCTLNLSLSQHTLLNDMTTRKEWRNATFLLAVADNRRFTNNPVLISIRSLLYLKMFHRSVKPTEPLPILQRLLLSKITSLSTSLRNQSLDKALQTTDPNIRIR